MTEIQIDDKRILSPVHFADWSKVIQFLSTSSYRWIIYFLAIIKLEVFYVNIENYFSMWIKNMFAPGQVVDWKEEYFTHKVTNNLVGICYSENLLQHLNVNMLTKFTQILFDTYLKERSIKLWKQKKNSEAHFNNLRRFYFIFFIFFK